MSFGDHTWPAITAVTIPDVSYTPKMDAGAVSGGPYFNPFGMPLNYVKTPDLKAIIAMDGWAAPRIMLDERVMRLGILPPDPDDMTATPTGNQAFSTLTCLASQPIGTAGGSDYITVGGGSGAFQVHFVDTLVTWDGTGYPPFPTNYEGFAVLKGADETETLENLKALINGDPGHDSIYVNFLIPFGVPNSDIGDNYGIFAGDVTDLGGSSTITITAIAYGTSGNSLNSVVTLNNGGALTFSATPLMTGGTTGTGDTPLAGSRVYSYRYYRKHDGAFSGIGNRVSAATDIPMEIALAGMVDSDDSDVSHKEWLRSLVKSGLFFRGKLVKTGTDTDTDDLTDIAIAAGEAYNDGQYRQYELGHIPNYSYPEIHYGSLFLAGGIRLEDYTTGTITVAKDSREVTFTGTALISPSMVGSILEVDNTGYEYILVEYDALTQVGKLNTTYKQDSGTLLGFALRSFIDPDELAWTEKRKWNQLPFRNTTRGASSNSRRGITGLKSHWESLQVFTENSIHRLSGTHRLNFQLRKVVEGAGTVSHGSIIEAEGFLYFVGLGVIYRWSGGEAVFPLSKPPMVQPGDAPGIHETLKRVNWDVPQMIRGRYDPLERKLRWVVPLDNEVYPTHTIVHDLQTGGWALDEGVPMSVEENFVGSGGQIVTLGGGVHASIYEMNKGEADAAYGITPVASILSVDEGLQTITFAGTPFTASELVGASALVKDANGEYQRLTIIKNTTSVIHYAEKLTLTIAAADQICFGAIDARMVTGEFTNGVTSRFGRITDLDSFYNPQALAGRLYLACGGDGDAPALPDATFSEVFGDLTDVSGHIRTRQNVRGRRHQIEVRMPLPGGEPEIIEVGYAYRTGVERKARR